MSANARGRADGKLDQQVPAASGAEAEPRAGERPEMSQEQRAVLAALTDNVVTLDGHGRITSIGRSEPGIDERQVLGSRWVDWLDETTRSRAEAALQATLQSGELQEIEVLAVGPERRQTWYEVRMAPLPSSSADAVVLMTADITRRRRTERDLRDALHRMEQAERTAHLGHWRHDARSGVLEPSAELLRILARPDGATADDSDSFVHPEDRAERRRLFERVLAGEPYSDHEWRAVRPDGAVRYLSGAAEPVFDKAGNVVAVFGVTQDVTERAEALQAARESAERYRGLLEHMLEGFVYGRLVFDEKGRPDDFVFLEVNPAYCRLIGRDDVVGKRLMEVLPAVNETSPEILELYGRVVKTGEPEQLDFYLAPVDRWLHVSATRPRDGEFVAFLSDVTRRKEAQRLADESELRLRLSLAAAGAGTWEWDIRTDENTWSDELWALYDIDPGEHEASYAAWRESVRPEERASVEANLAAAVAGGRELSFEWRVNTRDGSPRWLLSRGKPERDDAGDIIRYRGVVVDITERRLMERDLRRSEAEARETVERLTRAQRIGRMGDWEWDVAAGAVRWSEEVYRIFGVAPGFETTFETIVPMTHPDDSDSNLRAAQEILDDPSRPYGALNFRIVRPDGGVRHIFQTLAVDRDAAGKATRVFGIMQDVTELREAEEARAQSERSLRRFYDAGLVGVVYWTASGAITEANDRYLEMLGYTREELEAGEVDWSRMTPPEWAERDRASLEELRTTGHNAAPFEKEYYRKDGSRVPIVTAAATLDEGCTHGIALVLDIGDLKRAQDELRRLNLDLEDRVRRRTADLEAANTELEAFSYSVSHDLRAPLRHISGFATLLQERMGNDPEEAAHFLDRITQSAAGMGALIDDLLRFSRVGRAEMHIGRVDMAGLVADVLEVLGSDLGDRRVDVSVGEVLPALGDRTLLWQVWANLLGNAFKYTRPRDPATIEVGSRQEGDETVYWVRDDGVGFDMQYADRLFRVFERLHRLEDFEGTGIGLANVARILGRHGGRCWAESQLGFGSTFFFALPCG
jgi:PAS domain S-box-containing protein